MTVIASGDLIRTAMALVPGTTSDEFLEWLAAALRRLRTTKEVRCGAAGWFLTTASQGTVEIRPVRDGTAVARRVLDFRAAPALTAVVTAPTPEGLAALGCEDPLGSAFGQALATELIAFGRATVGNLGTWRLGKKPTLEVFVRFRPEPAANLRI